MKNGGWKGRDEAAVERGGGAAVAAASSAAAAAATAAPSTGSGGGEWRSPCPRCWLTHYTVVALLLVVGRSRYSWFLLPPLDSTF